MQHEVLDGMFTFYDSTSASLHIYQVHILLVSFYNDWQFRSHVLSIDCKFFIRSSENLNFVREDYSFPAMLAI